jgi:hypothetical protein
MNEERRVILNRLKEEAKSSQNQSNKVSESIEESEEEEIMEDVQKPFHLSSTGSFAPGQTNEMQDEEGLVRKSARTRKYTGKKQ